LVYAGTSDSFTITVQQANGSPVATNPTRARGCDAL
jgi:hypothetical protein